MRRLAIVILAALVSICLAEEQLTVQTQQGAIKGTLVVPGVRQFLGIPYAVTNRWEAPQSPPARTTTFEATGFGDTCVQELSVSNLEFLSLTGLGDQRVLESEDCLNINIWTPSSDRKQSTAVMIWIYGGGFEFGTSNTTFYNGRTLVENNDDVLLVTFNYRTNIFGFPNSPQLTGNSQSQNFGALDVEAAIQWVYSNIAAFGGDPNRITLFGQSAGSGLAAAYTFAHPTDIIVKGIIEESGSLAGMSPALTAFGGPLNSAAWNQVANSVGCGNVSTLNQFTCMQAVPFRTLENAVLSTKSDFLPVQDGITFFNDTSARSGAGNFLHVPLLVGNTAQEGDVFIISLEQQKFGFTIPGTISVASDIFTKIIFTCPAGTTANDYVRAGVPVWRYRYEAIFPDISSTPDLRAFHTSEIPIVFGTFNLSPLAQPPTDVEISLSRYVQGAWVAFARDPQEGLIHYGWPQYNPQTASLAQLGNSANSTGVLFASGDSFDGECQLIESFAPIFLGILNSLGGHA